MKARKNRDTKDSNKDINHIPCDYKIRDKRSLAYTKERMAKIDGALIFLIYAISVTFSLIAIWGLLALILSL